MKTIFKFILIFFLMLVIVIGFAMYSYFKPFYNIPEVNATAYKKVDNLFQQTNDDAIRLNASEFYGLDENEFLCIFESRKYGMYKYHDVSDMVKNGIALWRVPSRNTDSDYLHVFSFSPFGNRVKELHFLERSQALNESLSGCYIRDVTITIQNKTNIRPTYLIKFELSDKIVRRD